MLTKRLHEPFKLITYQKQAKYSSSMKELVHMNNKTLQKKQKGGKCQVSENS